MSRCYAQDVAVLAADEMEGRGLGTGGLERAARWIEVRLRRLGLRPAFGNTYRQPFPRRTARSVAYFDAACFATGRCRPERPGDGRQPV